MMVMTLVKLQHVAVLSMCLNQGEATRRREQELVKLRKDIELLTVQHESSEASLRKRHQEAINELNDQLEQLSKHRNKCAQRLFTSLHFTLFTQQFKIHVRHFPPSCLFEYQLRLV